MGQYDFGDGDTDATNRYRDGHGTHVAGTVAASTNNGTGVAGTCPNCSLLNAKVFDSNGIVYDSSVMPALNWATNNGARVINMSFGGPAYSSTLETVINRASSNGAVLVAAAMNNGTSGTKYYPAAYDNVIAVAATDSNDQKYFWSNSGDWVDVAAPGVDVYSTLPSEWTSRRAYAPASHSWFGVVGVRVGTKPREKTRTRQQWLCRGLRYSSPPTAKRVLNPRGVTPGSPPKAGFFMPVAVDPLST